MANIVNLINLGYILDFIKNLLAIIFTSTVSIYCMYKFTYFNQDLLIIILE